MMSLVFWAILTPLPLVMILKPPLYNDVIFNSPPPCGNLPIIVLIFQKNPKFCNSPKIMKSPFLEIKYHLKLGILFQKLVK